MIILLNREGIYLAVKLAKKDSLIRKNINIIQNEQIKFCQRVWHLRKYPPEYLLTSEKFKNKIIYQLSNKVNSILINIKIFSF